MISYRSFLYVSFSLWGALLYFFEAVVLTGSHDILAGTNLPTSTVFLSYAIPSFITHIIGGNLVIKIPYHFSVILIFLGMLSTTLTLAAGSNPHVKIVGVVIFGVCEGYGHCIILSLAPFFKYDKALAGYSAGTSMGFVGGSLYYTAMTTWLCLSPAIAIVILAPMLLLCFLYHYVIYKSRDVIVQHKSEYSKVSTNDREDLDQKNTSSDMSIKDRFDAFVTMLTYIGGPLFIAFFSEYILLQAIISTLAYQSSPFRPRDHYQYYFLILWIGEIFSRSHRGILGLINTKYLYPVRFWGLWLLAGLEVFLMFILLLESWYRFISNVGVVFLLCFSAGFVVGLLFSDSLEFFCGKLDARKRQYGMMFFSVPLTFAILVAGLLSFQLETQLREHCMLSTVNETFCFTRSQSFRDITLRCGT